MYTIPDSVRCNRCRPERSLNVVSALDIRKRSLVHESSATLERSWRERFAHHATYPIIAVARRFAVMLAKLALIPSTPHRGTFELILM